MPCWAGDGLARVAALAAAELGGAVAIVLPVGGVAVVEPRQGEDRLPALRRYASERILGRPADVPRGLTAEVAVHSGDERVGSVALLDRRGGPRARAILRVTMLAALTALVLEHGTSVTQRRARAALLADLRGTSPPSAHEMIMRARALGCDLSEGATARCVRPAPGDAERVLAVITQAFPGALAAARGDRVEGLLPAPADGTPAATATAELLAARLQRRAAIGLAPFEPEARALPAALRAAELALVLTEREGIGTEDLLTGSWRLLVRIAATDPPQLEALVHSTIGPALPHDGTPEAEPLLTLRAYFEHDANMNATAAAIYAHRHTIAYRLARIRELTGHDPLTAQGQGQLGLGLQATAVRHAAATRPRGITRRPGAVSGSGTAMR
jgi:hypothetical protein